MRTASKSEVPNAREYRKQALKFAGVYSDGALLVRKSGAAPPGDYRGKKISRRAAALAATDGKDPFRALLQFTRASETGGSALTEIEQWGSVTSVQVRTDVSQMAT